MQHCFLACFPERHSGLTDLSLLAGHPEEEEEEEFHLGARHATPSEEEGRPRHLPGSLEIKEETEAGPGGLAPATS